MFMSILQDIKGDIHAKQMPGQDITAEMFLNIRASVKGKFPVTLDDVISIVANQLSQIIEMNDETKDLFEALFLQIITTQNKK